MTSNDLLPDPSKILWDQLKSKRDHAVALAEAGFRIHPLQANAKGPPLLKDWPNQATADPTTARQRWTGPDGESADHNIGLAPDPGFMVVDFDRRSGGVNSYTKLTVIDDKLPATFTVRTRDGGYHVYLSCDEPLPSGANVLAHVDLPGVDLKSHGGYVLAPGSEIDGNSYQIVNAAPIARAPRWLLDALGSRRRKEPASQQPVHELDTPEGVSMAIEWLKRDAPEAIEGAGGDDATYRVAARLRDFAISESLALELLLDHWNEVQASPPWPPDELERKVRHAYAYGTATPGIEIARQAANEFPALPEAEIERIEASRRPDTAATVTPGTAPRAPIDWSNCHGEPPPLDWIWQDLIPRGHVTTLFGDGGTGKTLLAQQLATIMAAPSLEHDGLFGHAISPGNVVALFCEDDEDELWRRQTRINASLGLGMQSLDRFTAFSGYGDDNLLVHFGQSDSKATPAFEHLRKACDKASPDLVIIDNIADTFGGDEIRRVHVNQFLKTYLGGIARDFNCAVLLLGHPSNAGLSSGSGISGSRAWSNGVRSRLFMRRIDEDDPSPDPNARVLELMKANYAPTGTWVRVKWQDGAWAHVMGAAAGGMSAATGEPVDRADVVLSTMKRLISEGHILSPNDRASSSAIKLLLRSDEVAELRMGKEVLARTIDRLMRENEIHMEEYRGERSRHWHTRYAIGPKKDCSNE